MPRRVRNLGPYRGVEAVDVRGLYCYVSVEPGHAATTQPLVDGPWHACGQVQGRLVMTTHGITLVLRQADAVERGRIAKVHVVEPRGGSFYQDLASPLKVTMFVRPGTKVIY